MAATTLHVDLDAFFVSMELLRRPELRGLPVIVGGGPGPRGVVSTCSYEARKFGVHSAMPVARARRLCPQGIYLPSDFSFYGPASEQFHAILRDFTPTVEPAGADEAYLDVRGSERLFGSPVQIGEAIRRRVRDEIGITASVGIAANKLVAKVASDAAKPDGLLLVEVGAEAAFFAPRPLRELPMIGPRMAASLENLGIRTIGELAAMSPQSLVARFGAHGAELHRRALGQFDAPVLDHHSRPKSISRETTFEIDVADASRLHGILRSHADHVATQLARQGLAGRTVSLKLRFPPFETITRAETPGTPVSLGDDIARIGTELFDRAWNQHGQRPVRLVGLGLTGMVEAAHQLRFGEDDRAIRLASTIGEINDRFGTSVIQRGIELHNRRPEH